MELRFILGRAGAGKTGYIFKYVQEELERNPDGSPIIILVPEQATFQMEYYLSAKLGLEGSVRAQVLSFRRLAFRVLLETGGAARTPVGELGKRMILRRLLEKHKHELRLFGSTAGRPGFPDCLARSIGEMKTYLISPEKLENAASLLAENGRLLTDKLTDMAFLYKELEKQLEDSYTDPDDYLNLLAEQMPKAETFNQAEFWIDGFKGFTPQELKVIEAIVQSTGAVNISLCIDSTSVAENLTENDVFYPVWETYNKLKGIGDRLQVKIASPVTFSDEPPRRFCSAGDLAHLEKYFFSYPAPQYPPNPGNVRIAAAANRRAEVEACAREIIRQARDEGRRWRDFTVLLRELEMYHDLITGIFTDHQIPFFIDHKRKVMHHPLIELIRSALETSVKNWAYEPVFRYLKTDLVPVDRESIYMLENYVLANGIKGFRWTDDRDWSYRKQNTLGDDRELTEEERAGLAQINDTRRRAAGALTDFCRKIDTAGNVREMTAILYELLEDLGAWNTIKRWRETDHCAGNIVSAREHTQVWKSVIDLFDEVVEALGDEQTDLPTYAGILEAGFAGLTLGMIPPGLDQVVVGSLDRSRNPDVKNVFILGASDGVFPARLSDDGIFNDTERERLELAGISLAPGSRKKSFEEQFLVYTALTRASERLWVSYPLADDEGRAIGVSPVISRIRELLPGVREDGFQVEPFTGSEAEGIEFLVHPGRALSYLAGRLRDARTGRPVHGIWWELYNRFILRDGSGKAGQVMNAVFGDNTEKNLSRSTSSMLYGKNIKASVSRIERFVSCPFAHFSSYGLKLKERNTFRLEAPDMGELFHAALKGFAQAVERKGDDWGNLSREECLRLSEQTVDELIPGLQNQILLSSARYRHLAGKLKRAVNRAALILTDHARRSSFRPCGLEISFGPGGLMPAKIIQLPGGETLELAGRIDRLDQAVSENSIYLRVIDYKSGDRRLNLEEVYYGLSLQLITYLHVALEYFAKAQAQGCLVKPAGILYFTVTDPLLPVPGPMTAAEAERAVALKLKMKGLLLDNRAVFRLMDAWTETGYSDLFPVGIKNDGTFYSSAPVIGEKQFELLCRFVETIFQDYGKGVLGGNVNISPYKMRHQNACQYCRFKPVCSFDTLMEGNLFRVLRPVPENELWQRISMTAAGEGGKS
ncbi:helicase-exonuclease AddAB subunit AddB [Phosphitispora fastidiosa]|uniref:helicase-exonuclease AddAB subunit AddB n=1 Tax=Phosphitispora fastidiosa TaxID=2837202 RepID=UPI001E624C83|nr:helicase-exonuclease AddAB subunit AddB [Phosphitispora fastidiosa]MBU7005382.1 ATP-dependent helicase/nuclease subunit B [Phosphitispora fastidiosa]